MFHHSKSINAYDQGGKYDQANAFVTFNELGSRLGTLSFHLGACNIDIEYREIVLVQMQTLQSDAK